jgi:tetratricopeptide (TPR) repeat protein
MTLYRPLWYPPNRQELAHGAKVLTEAKGIGAKSARERDYIGALSLYFTDVEKTPHAQRAKAYSDAMNVLRQKHADDTEATIFYALALRATAPPTDKTYKVPLESAGLLEPLFARMPDHPGIAHYLIHDYDFPALAEKGVAAARKYSKIAPAVPHALHMPSHIFIRLGMWDDAISSNIDSADSAEKYAREGDALSWNEKIHALDYLMYAHLQRADLKAAKAVLDELNMELKQIPSGGSYVLTGSYGGSSIPARFYVEQRMWKEAAALRPLEVPPAFQAITYWARALGAAHSGDVNQARADVAQLTQLAANAKGDALWGNDVEVQRLSAGAWLAHAEGKAEQAVTLMRQARELEAKTDKHPVMPGRIWPAYEMLAELLVAQGKPGEALTEYEAALKDQPKRYMALKGAAAAAEKAGQPEKAAAFRKQLPAGAQQASR